MSRLTLKLFGPPQILLDDQPVETDRRKAVALLIYLAVMQKAVTRDALAALLWPDTEPSRAYAYLRRALWEVNNVLGEGWLDADRERVALVAAGVWVDVNQFRQNIAACDPATAGAACIPVYREAVDQGWGEFMAGFSLRDAGPFEEWQQFQGAALRQEWFDAVAVLVDLLTAAGDLETAVSYARRWLLRDPLQEAAHRSLMLLYARLGQRVEAIRQYETCAQLLADELGVAPEPETTALLAQIKAGELSPSPAAAPPQTPPAAAAAMTPKPALHNLPAQPTPFVGREAELQAIRQMIADPDRRLVTLVGPGGSGKTRLGLQAAAEALPHYPDGVWFAPLAVLTTPEQVVTAVARALQFSFSEDGGPLRQQLLDYLRQQHLLLLLDNFEQLLAAGGAAVCSDILRAAPHVSILVTSRMRLNVQGETSYAVEGLTFPEEETAAAWTPQAIPQHAEKYSALSLFLQSAARAQPDFQLTPHNVRSVVRICRLVEGMPLGIELAAAWTELLTPDEIYKEIEKSLDFLETELEDVPARQRSMRAVFNYSWSLMAGDERTLFPRLAIFHGSFSRAAAEAVARAPLRTLMRLVNKSLVRREEDGRFAIHELLRQYAAERLQDSADDWIATRDRHSRFYLDFLLRETPRMKGAEQKAAFDAVTRQIEDIRAAWLWAVVQREYDAARQALEGLFVQHLTRSSLEELAELLYLVLDDVETAAAAEFAQGQTQTEAQRLHATLVAMQSFATSHNFISPQPPAYSRQAFTLMDKYDVRQQMGFSFLLAAMVYHWRVDRQKGLALAYEGLEMIAPDDNWSRATGTSFMADALWSLGRRSEAKATLQEGIALSRAIGDRLLLAYNLGSMTMVTSDEHDFDQTIRLYEECCQIYEALGNWIGVGNSLVGIATTYDALGEYEQARTFYRYARDVFTRIGARLRAADSMSWESLSVRRLGHYGAALALRQSALDLFTQIEDANGIAWSHYEFGELYRLHGDEALAWSHYETARQMFVANEMGRGLAFYHRIEGWHLLQQGSFEAAGQALKKALDLALADYHNWNVAYIKIVYGYLATAVSDYDAARGHLQEALSLTSQLANLGISLEAIAGFAHLAAQIGRPEEAAALVAFVLYHPATWHETKEAITAVSDAVAAQLSPAQKKDALEEGRAWTLEQVVQRLLPA